MLHPKILKCVESCVTETQANSCLNFMRNLTNEQDRLNLRDLVDAKIKNIRAIAQTSEFRPKTVEMVDKALDKASKFFDRFKMR